MVILAAVGVQRLADRDRDVDPDQVDQGQRPHRVAGAEGHAAVDLLRLHPGLLEQPDGIEQVGEQQAVDDETGLVRDLDHRLADRLAPGPRPHRDRGIGRPGDTELDQLHPDDGVEGVESERPLRRTGGVAQGLDSERRGRARQVGCRAAPRESSQQLDLGIGLLDDRLDHQVRVGQVGGIGRDLDVARLAAVDLGGEGLGLLLGPPRRRIGASEQHRPRGGARAGRQPAGDRAAAGDGRSLVCIRAAHRRGVSITHSTPVGSSSGRDENRQPHRIRNCRQSVPQGAG